MHRDLARTVRNGATWSRVGGWAIIALALAAGVRWGIKRFNESLAFERAHDLEDYFLPAANSILAGGSPFDVWGYVHSPAAALALAGVQRLGGDPKQVWMASIPVVALVVCVVWSVALTSGSALWMTGTTMLFCTATLFTSRQLTRQFWMGQYDLFLLLLIGLGLLFHQRGRTVAAGFLLALPAALKLWPALFLTVLLTRSYRSWRHLVGMLLAALLAVVLCLPFGGIGGVVTLVQSAAGFGSQGLIAYSGFGIGKGLFLPDGEVVPLLLSPAAAVISVTVLTGLAVVLLGMVVWRATDAAWSLAAVLVLGIMIVPVSHLSYQLFAMPLLWLTFASALADPLRWRLWPGLVIGSAWWVKVALQAPIQAPGERTGMITAASFILQAALFFLHGAAGAVYAATRSDSGEPTVPVLGSDHDPTPIEGRPRRHA